jgi:(R,R)-butanediol dehydrogenase / meso-butanediol dehydrogenase / diacetyl reductase
VVNTMQALRYHGNKDLRVDTVPEPEPGQGEVKIKVEWCGICGTDVHEYVAGPILTATPATPHPITGRHMPITMGHEFAGRVVSFGADVAGLAIDDAVAVEPLIRCTECAACLAGDYNRCELFGFLGSHADGAYARYVVVPAYMVHRIPEGVSTEEAAVAEPIVVGWHAVRRARFRPGQTALVNGAGPIGIGVLIALKAAGASEVVVAEIGDSKRRRIALDFGASAVIDPATEDVESRVLEELGGTGADVVFDTSAVQAGMDTAVGAVRKGGTIVTCGIWESLGTLDYVQMVMKEITLVGTLGYANEYGAVLEAMASGLIANVTNMVTARLDLDSAADGFSKLFGDKANHVKILVRP